MSVMKACALPFKYSWIVWRVAVFVYLFWIHILESEDDGYCFRQVCAILFPTLKEDIEGRGLLLPILEPEEDKDKKKDKKRKASVLDDPEKPADIKEEQEKIGVSLLPFWRLTDGVIQRKDEDGFDFTFSRIRTITRSHTGGREDI